VFVVVLVVFVLVGVTAVAVVVRCLWGRRCHLLRLLTNMRGDATHDPRTAPGGNPQARRLRRRLWRPKPKRGAVPPALPAPDDIVIAPRPPLHIGSASSSDSDVPPPAPPPRAPPPPEHRVRPDLNIQPIRDVEGHHMIVSVCLPVVMDLMLDQNFNTLPPRALVGRALHVIDSRGGRFRGSCLTFTRKRTVEDIIVKQYFDFAAVRLVELGL
jgi:hypothetical protein